MTLTRLMSFIALIFAAGSFAVAQNGPATRPVPKPISTAQRMQDQGIRFAPNVAYLGDNRKERMDLYWSAANEKQNHPAILIIHGGGWVGGSKSSERELQIVETLCPAGYVCASIEYRLATKGHGTWPGVFDDCRAAVTFLRTNASTYHIDPSWLGIIGSSAGGHLSLLLGTDPSMHVNAIVALYPPSDLTVLDPERSALIGFPRADRPDLYKAASPTQLLTADFPRTLILHGSGDKQVPLAQSQRLDTAMTKLNIPHEFIIVDGAPHGFLIKDEHHDLRKKIVEFFDEALHVSAPSKSAEMQTQKNPS